MKDLLIEKISQALRESSNVLGSCERNTEIKIAYLALWALGWDPVADIGLGFQIPAAKIGPKAGGSNAPDFVVRDGAKIFMVGEAKYWAIDEHEPKKWKGGQDKLSTYLHALPAPRGFLTCGKTWIITDQRGQEITTIRATNDGRKLIDQLQRHIGKGSISDGYYSPKAWDYGICPSSQ